ncbi:MAG TPA: hypothetical protein VF170_08560, partial [Planctomycetaceae bacterium]
LYSLHFGVIPGIGGSPTNLGLDPYLATRGQKGWTTKYVGVPANGMEDDGAFGSPLLGADSGLRAFAFGGPDICNPCFDDGSTNIPLRLPNGELVKGMAGSLSPAADPAGEVREHFSADGSHFVFGSEEKFEGTGKQGEVSIYDRNLGTGNTQVVSTLPNGQTMSGDVAQLDISADGGRVLVGQVVGTDSAGNRRYDLYMHVGASPNSVLVADTANGVIYNGMSSDGTKVFFTSSDQIGGEADSGADLFRADVGTSGPATLTRVSTGGGAGDTDSCSPTGNWNVVAGGPDCSIVAIAGGGGVADDGTAYFFSPERLAGPTVGTDDEPNLYAVEPGGSPQFVATLEPDNVAVENGVENSEAHSYADFQVTPDGRYAAFNTRLELVDYPNIGFNEIYRSDLGDGSLDCVSCAPTGAVPASDTSLLRHGLNLTDDGRVFYTTTESFA